MGVRILSDRDDEKAALYCSTTGWAFGPLFLSDSDRGLSATDAAENFLKFLDGTDPRSLSDKELERAYSKYLVAYAARS